MLKQIFVNKFLHPISGFSRGNFGIYYEIKRKKVGRGKTFVIYILTFLEMNNIHYTLKDI